MKAQYDQFKCESVKESESDILIKGFCLTERTGSHYISMSMYISPLSIPDIIKVITDKGIIENRNLSEHLSEYNFENAADSIHFSYMGSDQDPILNIRSRKHVLKNEEIVRGSISIPIGVIPGSSDDMKYLLLFADELKKYI
jgi:hypothetical protein